MKHKAGPDIQVHIEQKTQIRLEVKDPDMQRFLGQLRELKNRRKQFLKRLDQLNPDRLPEKRLKKLTVLHSNDLHGDFLAEEVEKSGAPAELASNAPNVLIEYFDSHDYIRPDKEKRLLIHDAGSST